MSNLPVITDLSDPRPRRLVKFLKDYNIPLTSASFSVGYTGESRTTAAIYGIHIQLNRLVRRNLTAPLDVLVEPDDQGFCARAPDLPSCGYGQNRIEAIDRLKEEIEALYDELLEEDELDETGTRIKEFLTVRIAD
jgi:predicted RNase H-like HicB family nuclease